VPNLGLQKKAPFSGAFSCFSNCHHNPAISPDLLKNKFAWQPAASVENFVDYLPPSPAKIPISPLASCGHFLLCGLNPYLSTENPWVASPVNPNPNQPAAASRLDAFHNR
jgi:hypothetical protein